MKAEPPLSSWGEPTQRTPAQRSPARRNAKLCVSRFGRTYRPCPPPSQTAILSLCGWVTRRTLGAKPSALGAARAATGFSPSRVHTHTHARAHTHTHGGGNKAGDAAWHEELSTRNATRRRSSSNGPKSCNCYGWWLQQQQQRSSSFGSALVGTRRPAKFGTRHSVIALLDANQEAAISRRR